MSWKMVAALTCSAALVAGCGGSLEGNWQSREPLPNNKRNKLFLEEGGGGGELKMYTYVRYDGNEPVLAKLKFDVKEWFLEDDGDYEVQFECSSGCGNEKLDFEMDCGHDEDAEHLDCKAKSPFREYGFLEFEREPDE